MAISEIFSYLVSPAKAESTQPAISGAKIPPTATKLYKMLSDVYGKADSECNIDISFNYADDGSQQNQCRDLIIAHVKKPALATGRAIAKQLQSITTKRSGLGLLFLITGHESPQRKIVVSRFPADSAIRARKKGGSGLSVEFLEEVFMKSATAYKAARYVGTSFDADFWDGRAVDKQVTAKSVDLSDYWIKDFLKSDFKTTAAQGTRRLAVALRDAINDAKTLKIKDELVAASRLLPQLKGKSISISSVAKRYTLSADATATLKSQIKNPDLFTQQFSFSGKEYESIISYESTELNNGGILTAPAGHFSDVFKQKQIAGGETQFTTQGKVVDKKLRKGKS